LDSIRGFVSSSEVSRAALRRGAAQTALQIHMPYEGEQDEGLQSEACQHVVDHTSQSGLERSAMAM